MNLVDPEMFRINDLADRKFDIDQRSFIGTMVL